jgi:hypothetical protein
LAIHRSIVFSCFVPSIDIGREREEEYDRVSYAMFWKLASDHPEAGIAKMHCVEYHDLPLAEAGILRPGQKEVWFKDVVHDV